MGDIFQRLAKDLAGDVPLKVINDGEVTALAAVQKIKAGNVLGISMGSSEGGGYANEDGNLLGWINELCYIRHENHAQCLKLIQKAMTDPAKEPEVRQLYRTVGVYLGYGLAQYCEFYKIDHVMILGRVSKGAGGDLMLEVAKKVLETEFPEYAGMQFHTADDHFKAVGQCIAAAALPEFKSA